MASGLSRFLQSASRAWLPPLFSLSLNVRAELGPIDCRIGSYRFGSAERMGDEHESSQRRAMQETQEEEAFKSHDARL
jgi:hypothetical protein